MKKLYVSKAYQNDFFVNRFLPEYYSLIDNFEFDLNFLAFFSKYSQVDYRYRIKLKDTTLRKLRDYMHKEKSIGSIPLNKCLNDIFGTRIILAGVNDQHEEIVNLLNSKKADNK